MLEHASLGTVVELRKEDKYRVGYLHELNSRMEMNDLDLEVRLN